MVNLFSITKKISGKMSVRTEVLKEFLTRTIKWIKNSMRKFEKDSEIISFPKL